MAKSGASSYNNNSKSCNMHGTTRLQLLLLCACATLCYAALPLPSYIKPCSRNDPNLNQCALEHGRKVIPHVINGDRKYKMPRLDPMDIDEIKVVDDGDRPAGLSMTLKKAKVYGLSKTHIDKTEYDLKKQHIHYEVTVPQVVTEGKYDVNGRVLLLPITGSGDVNITLDDVKVVYDTDFELKTVDGLRHIYHQNPRATASPSRMHIHLTNLFGGDKLLNKQMNVFLNENWREVFKDLSPTLFQVFTQIVFQSFRGMDSLVSYDDIFPDKV